VCQKQQVRQFSLGFASREDAALLRRICDKPGLG